MASNSGTIYIGVTGDLKQRVWQHKMDLIIGFSKKYQCHKLVYFEEFENVEEALAREKQIKKWRREKKTNLIKKFNPGWRDLALDYGWSY